MVRFYCFRFLHSLWAVFFIFSSFFLFIIIVLLLYAIVRAIYQAYATPLRDIPGPWLAKYTRLWQLQTVNARSFHNVNIALHKKHGRIVRIGPNEYSIDDPEAAKIIYRPREQLEKSARYSGWGLPGAEQNLFAERNIQRHAERRRQTAGLYRMSSLNNVEHKIDQTEVTFFERMASFARTGESFEINQWLHYFAFDVIGEIALGKAFNFLGTGGDVSGIMAAIHAFSRYGAVVGVISELHPFIFCLTQMLAPAGGGALAYIAQFCSQAIADQVKKGGSNKRGDILSSMYADGFSIEDIQYHSIPNIGAGSDTTAISLSAAIYFLLKNPEKMVKLRKELDEKRAQGRFSTLITNREAQECTYLQAVLKETFRLHPGNGLPMPRVVPKGGLALAGCFFPEGSIVGINSYVAHANTSIFGPDAHLFVPERWLVDQEIVNRMDQYFFTFGRGPRTCLGKNISLMEMSKLIPELILRFEIELVWPEREWRVYNDWFMRQKEFWVRVRVRGGA